MSLSEKGWFGWRSHPNHPFSARRTAAGREDREGLYPAHSPFSDSFYEHSHVAGVIRLRLSQNTRLHYCKRVLRFN